MTEFTRGERVLLGGRIVATCDPNFALVRLEGAGPYDPAVLVKRDALQRAPEHLTDASPPHSDNDPN